MGNNQNGEIPSSARRNVVIPVSKKSAKVQKKTSLDKFGGGEKPNELPKVATAVTSKPPSTLPVKGATVTQTLLPQPANFPILKEDFPDLKKYQSQPLSHSIPIKKSDFEPIYRQKCQKDSIELQLSFRLGTFMGLLRLISGVPEASGLFQFTGGDIYKGVVADGQFGAEGTYLFADGTAYTGSFFENKFEGIGEIRFANGESYKGSFVEGRMEGRGEYRWKDGTVFRGILKNGLKQGVGDIHFGGSGHFVGDFADDEITGMGRLTGRFGVVYEGQFSVGKRSGNGVLRNGAGDSLKVRFVDNKPEGQGTLVEADRTYEVQFQAGLEISRECV
jgi:hypothetical protein